MVSDKHLREVASIWLGPVDELLADLLDKSERMTIGAFAKEIERVIDQIPLLFDKLNIQHLSDDLEEKIGDQMIKQLKARFRDQ